MASSEQFNTDATKKVLAPFGNQNSSLVNAIPLNASGGRVNEASWNGGFPSITTLPVGSGGKPPSGLDFNGIFNVLSNSIYNSQCGYNINEYNSDWANAVGGYPKGAVVWYPSGNSTEKKMYISLEDNNSSLPTTSSWKGITTSTRFIGEWKATSSWSTYSWDTGISNLDFNNDYFTMSLQVLYLNRIYNYSDSITGFQDDANRRQALGCSLYIDVNGVIKVETLAAQTLTTYAPTGQNWSGLQIRPVFILER